MRFFQDRGPDTIGSEQSSQPRECFIKLIRIRQSRFKQSKLLRGRFNRFRLQRDGDNRMLRFEILQVRLEHSEQKIGIVGRLRNFERALVTLLVRKSDPQR